jgi:N-succinyldiaminopimelate aminotransferase
MRERTITISSASKTFSATGWKVGWACAAPELISAVRTTKQFLSFSGGTPLQHAVAHALHLPDEVYDELASAPSRRRDLLIAGLTTAGLAGDEAPQPPTSSSPMWHLGLRGRRVVLPSGARRTSGSQRCRCPPSSRTRHRRSLVRFAYCKRDEVLEEGVATATRAREPSSSTGRRSVTCVSQHCSTTSCGRIVTRP